MRGLLEFPEGARGQPCLAAQPARLCLPCPRPPCPPAQRRLAAFPRLRRSRGRSCKALTGQYRTCFGPCSGLSEDPFPALTNSHTLYFSPDLCCRKKYCLQLLMLWGDTYRTALVPPCLRFPTATGGWRNLLLRCIRR